MSTPNNGKEFEKLVESIYRRLKKNDKYEKVYHNVQLEGLDGKRQIDVLIQAKIAGVEINVIVECKDHKRKIPVGQIDAFHSKLLDVKANKGIFISKNGFSTKSVSKAKRLGITLCTAHEVLSEKWEPDIDFDILIEEIKPLGFHFEMNGTFNTEIYNKIDFMKINNISIGEFLNNKWRKGTIDFERIQGFQKIKIDELNAPYIITDEKDVQLGIFQKLDIYLELRIMVYKTSLRELKGSKILENLTDDFTNMFIEIPSLDQLDGQLKTLSTRDLQNFVNMIISIRVKPGGLLRSIDHPFIANGLKHDS